MEYIHLQKWKEKFCTTLLEVVSGRYPKYCHLHSGKNYNAVPIRQQTVFQHDGFSLWTEEVSYIRHLNSSILSSKSGQSLNCPVPLKKNSFCTLTKRI